MNDRAEKTNLKNYRSLVGSLIYLTNTRSNIVYTVNFIFRFMHEPSKNHYIAAKRILHYFQKTKKTLKSIMIEKKIANLLGIQIVIGQAQLMITKAILEFFFFLFG